MISEVGSILMLHRVAPYESEMLAANEDMKISPDELRQVIEEFKSRKVEFVSLDELQHRVEHNIKSPFGAVAFTLDDGYKDNLEIAYPIFREQNIPFCVYITNSFPRQSSNLWWYALEELIQGNQTLSFPSAAIDNSTEEAKKRNFLLLRQAILDKHYRDPLSFMKSVGHSNFDRERQVQEKCLTWDEVVRLSQDPLVTIGAHTVNHYPLANLPINEAEEEIGGSRRELQERIGKPIIHLAFPFGGKPEAYRREYSLARAAGFRTATTTIHGYVYKNDNLMCLPRIFLRPLRNNSITLNDIMQRSIKDPLKFAVRVLLN